MDDDATLATPVPAGDRHRREAAHLYGLIVTGAVLATAPDEFHLVRIAILMLGTLTIYWAAETYAHWIAARALVRRGLRREERRRIIRDGWPLVAACAVPLLFLTVEALLGVETARALDLTLVVNTMLLFILGWQMGRAGGLRGGSRALSAATTGLLGLALIALKASLH